MLKMGFDRKWVDIVMRYVRIVDVLLAMMVIEIGWDD